MDVFPAKCIFLILVYNLNRDRDSESERIDSKYRKHFDYPFTIARNTRYLQKIIRIVMRIHDYMQEIIVVSYYHLE